MGLGSSYKAGWTKAVPQMGNKDYGQTVLPITKSSKDFYSGLKKEGIGLDTPAQLAGAMGARVVTDLGTDSTRQMYWRYNHPMAISEKIGEKIIGEGIKSYSPTQRAAIGLAAIGIPVGASLGTFDATNLSEYGRPKGFAQSYAEQGSEDRRETGQLAPELVDRFVLGRQGRPLKYQTAKEDIPNLTKERYANYMNYLYNDKGPLGIGIVKGTMENLEGVPEARIVGFPVGLQAAGALVGGAAATRAALGIDAGEETVPGGIGPKQRRTKKSVDTSTDTPGSFPRDTSVYRKGERAVKVNSGSAGRTGTRVDTLGPRARTVAALGAAGALGGALAGKFVNTMIASAGQSDLPTTQEYGITRPMV